MTPDGEEAPENDESRKPLIFKGMTGVEGWEFNN